MKKKISIIIPMYYEEDMVNICHNEIKKILKKITKYDYEYIYVNDGSQDKTEELLEHIAKDDKKIKIISFSRNFGHQAAVSAGLKATTGDAAIILDADLQDPPKVIPDMIKLWEQGYDIVYGKRKKRYGETFFKLFTAKMFYRILNKLSTVHIPEDTGDFRLIDRKVIDAINNMKEHNKFLRGLYSYAGFKQIPLLYERDIRKAGKTKYSLKKMFSLASDGIIGFSYKPLNFILIISILLGFISILSLIAIFIWIKKYMLPLIIFLFSFNTSLILFAIWLLSLYISRIYDEVKNRPSYIIEKTINIEKK